MAVLQTHTIQCYRCGTTRPRIERLVSGMPGARGDVVSSMCAACPDHFYSLHFGKVYAPIDPNRLRRVVESNQHSFAEMLRRGCP